MGLQVNPEMYPVQDDCELDEGDNGPRGGVPTVENPPLRFRFSGIRACGLGLRA